MPTRPTLTTERLVLRPFTVADAPDVARLAGDRAIAEMTLRIPHPYSVADAESWLATHEGSFAEGESVVWAITLKARGGASGGELLGAIGLELNRADFSRHRAELGYWIGREHWGNGYTTEAGRAVLRYGFETLGLHRIFACYFTKNPASGRVQEKLGMKREGLLRGAVLKWGEHLDEVVTAILRSEWQARKESDPGA